MIWSNTEVKSFFNTGVVESNAFMENVHRVGGAPYYNEPVAASVPGVYKSNVGTAKVLMKEVLRSPEMLGILNALVGDLLHGFHFEAIENESSGPGRKKNDAAERVRKAEQFAKKNMIITEFEPAYRDWLITGDAYLWTGIPHKDEIEIQKIIQKTAEKYNIPNFPSEVKVSEFFDEDFQGKRIEHVASTTMEPLYNERRVYGFKQAIGSATLVDASGTRELDVQTGSSGLIEKQWPSEDIIHAKFMDIDGKVWGYTPTQALLPIISTLAMHKDYMGHFFDNNGVPNKLFMFKKAHPSHPSVKALEKVLLEQRSGQNKQRNLILTSEVEVQDLNKFDKDMEFRQLATYYTGIIALVFNMPIDRIQAIVVDQKPVGSDINDTAYWRSISKAQRYWADLLNGQFFNEELGVDIVFDNPFIQDKIRIAQEKTQMLAAGNQMLQMGIDPEYVFEFLDIPEKYRANTKLKEIETNAGQLGKSPENSSNPNKRAAKAGEQAKKVDRTQEKNPGT